MTDPEKRAVSERLATLAEAAGLPTELVYLQYWECSDGHINPVKFEPMYCFQTLPHTVNNTVSCRKPVHPIMVGRDLTDTAVLLPLVEAWVDAKAEPDRWIFTSSRRGNEWRCSIAHKRLTWWEFVTEQRAAATRGEAEAQALCAAMESEKGGAS